MVFDQKAGSVPGIETWRIEKMEPVRIPAEKNGQLYSGDAYIILKTVEEKNKRSYDLFFWLGKECSQDEQGAAAYHTVNLDDQLGGKAVQHREVQGFESQKFMAAFPKGVQYLDGGIASGFKHVDPNAYETRLFQLKGKRNVRVQQVPLTADSMNDGDVFILDTGLIIYQWNGSKANKYEKIKGLEMVTKINGDERGGKAEITVVEAGHETPQFWTALGGKKAIKSDEAGGSDDAKDQKILQLYELDGLGGIRLIAENKLDRSALATNGIYVVYNGSEAYIWVGKGSSADDKKKSMAMGMSFLKDKQLPNSTPLSRINESGETPSFKAQFTLWDPIRVVNAQEHKAAPRVEEVDTSDLYQRRKQAEEKLLTLDGDVEVWRIENFNKVAQPKESFGQFFMGDSYIIKFHYKANGKDKFILYFWQGRDSSTDEKGTSALLVKAMDDELKGQAPQVRVVQNKEPTHFLALFKGKFIVHSGGHASAFANRKDTDHYDAEGVALYHVRGNNSITTRAVQVPSVPASLNSGDSFVLLTPESAFIWFGEGANDDERATARNIAKILQRNRPVVEVKEDSEPEEFWTALGGKADYPRTKALEAGSHEPRLFQCTDVKGFKVEEIFDFSQDDLLNDDVMILDAYEEVFVWIGRDSTQKEKDSAILTALEYVKKAPDGRSPDTPVMKVLAGEEPPSFTCHFLGWSESKALDFTDPYAKKLGLIPAKKPALSEHKSAVAVTAADVGFKTGVFTAAQLKAGVPDIDTTKKEQYLSDAEFHDIFKVTKAEFAALPAWKQTAKKKEFGLF